MSLLPASGFQSAQYRKIEICSAPFIRLVDQHHRDKFDAQSRIENMYPFIYWRAGATEIDTGKKTLTLTQFEQKYDGELLRLAVEYKNKNLATIYHHLSEEDKNHAGLKEQLRKLDQNVNVHWPLVHYKSAVRYLHKQPSDVAATGGTNWQKYLPPRFQKRIFFPELWSQTEIEEWGKAAFETP